MIARMVLLRGLVAPCLLVGAMLGGAPALGQAPAVGDVERTRRDAARAVTEFVEPFVDQAMFDGTILVDVGGEVVYERSFGLAHREFDIAHGPHTRFRIGSVSKTLTDAAFAVLVQREVLSLDAPLARYLPAFPSADSITVGQLLSHSSGIPHLNDLPWGDGSTSLGLDDIVSRLARLPLDFEPGTDSNYSNGGYAVAAKVLEIVGGASFAQVMRATVLDPLGMADTGHIVDGRMPIPRMASGYQPGGEPGQRRHARFYAVETRPGGGSGFSSARDLLRFTRAIFRDGFIGEPLRREVLGADGGEFLAQGRSPGFVAKLLFDPRRDVIVVSLANNYAVPADWARAIADRATGAPDAVTWPRIEPSPAPVAASDPRLGRYRSSRGTAEVEIGRSERGGLIISGEDAEPPVGLIPLADGAFVQPMYFQRCEQAASTRVITCRMLSGNRGYRTVLVPVAGTDHEAGK